MWTRAQQRHQPIRRWSMAPLELASGQRRDGDQQRRRRMLVLSIRPGCHQCAAVGGRDLSRQQDFNGQDQLTMVTNDLGNTGSGGALSGPMWYLSKVQPVNDAPVNQLPGSMTVKEGWLSVAIQHQREGWDAGRCLSPWCCGSEHGVLTLLGATGAVVVQGANTSGSPWWGRWPISTSCWQTAACTMNRPKISGGRMPHCHYLGSRQQRWVAR